VVGELGYRAAPRNTTMRAIANGKDRTDEVVEQFHAAIAEQKPTKLTFKDHLAFRLMQASYARLETMSPTDHRYWKEQGWLDRKAAYFHANVRGSVVKDWIARGAGWMTGRQIDRTLADTT
ncbi:MAG: hypothetical protein PVI80_19565, partial [Anaerolineae bacterium]|jgi:hypothetical protein